MSAAYKAVIPQNICFYGEDRKWDSELLSFFFFLKVEKK